MRPIKLDTEFTRANFPAFSEPGLRGWSHFENAGGSYACRHVIWRLARFYKERKVQPYGPSEPQRLAGEEMDDARIALSQMLGIQVDELSFGPSTTQNAYVLAQAFGETLMPGDVVVVTDQDHEANIGAWRRLARRGVVLREWRVGDDGHLDPADLRALMDDRVRLVCFPHCSNIVGEINDAAAICAMVRAAGAVSCVDGVSYAPHGMPALNRIGADIYLFSGYKTYGPHQGLMYVRKELAQRLPNQGHDFNGADLTKRFTPAGPDHAQVAACAGIADYFEAQYRHHFSAGRDAKGRATEVSALFRDREVALMLPLLDYLDSRRDIRLLGPRDPNRRAPTLALALDRPADDVAASLARLGVIAGAGDFYAPRLLAALRVPERNGVLRLSFLHYTEEQEVDRLIEALDRVV